MAHETGPLPAAPPTEHGPTAPAAGEPTPAGAAPGLVAGGSRRMFRRLLWLGGVGAVLAAGVMVFLSLRSNGALRASHGVAQESAGDTRSVISVNTVRPTKKTIRRVLNQPGSIESAAEAELYTKASGYLKHIQRTPTPTMVTDLVAQSLAVSGPLAVSASRLACAAQVAIWMAPQKDIGSPVTSGEILLEIAAPERLQDVVEKEALLQQRQGELDAARTALAMYDAAVEAARAQQAEAQADIRKSEAEHTLRSKEFARLSVLVASGSVTPYVGDEKQHQVDAALAALETSRAKVQTAKANLAVATSKHAAAGSDLKVKELLVQVAREGVRQAEIQAEFGQIRAPFDGIITYRGVDEGDFVQNATSGQARRLMTITAIDTVKVVLQVPEKDTPWVRVGTAAVFTGDARRLDPLGGRVTRLAYVLDPNTRTMQVEVDLDNRDRRLLPGMYGQVTLTLQEIPDAQATPATVLYSRMGENYILEVRDGVVHRQRVRVRYDDGKEVEVVKLIGDREVPLDGSEELVISNKGEIAEGQRVRSIPVLGH